MTTKTPILALRRFAHDHDEIPAFHAAYIVTTFLAAAMLQMGVFLVLIAAHMTLDYIKYRDVHHCSFRRTFEGMVRESLADMALLAVGFFFAVYLHHQIGLMGVGGVVLAELTVLRAVGTVFPKLHVLHTFLGVAMHMHEYMHARHPLVGKPFSTMERVCLFTIPACLILLVLAPSLMQVRSDVVVRVLMEQILP